MTEEDLRRIESALGIQLPGFYRSTMIDYPFPTDSFADEFLLPNAVEPILELNRGCEGLPRTCRAFLIGSDGGEELYFVDLDGVSSRVFLWDLESGECAPRAQHWNEYLRQVTASLREIDEDEQREREQGSGGKWWQLWKK